MDARGSLRQLHQQVSGFNGFDGGSNWQATKQRPPPPPPSLPPWAGSLAVDADDTAGLDHFGSGWNKPKPLRGHPPKRLVAAVIPPLQRRVPQQIDEQQPEERTEADADSVAVPSVYRPQRVLAPVASTSALQQQQDETRQENQREAADGRQQQQREPSNTLLRSSPSRSNAERGAPKDDEDGNGDGVTALDPRADASNQSEDSPENKRSATPFAGFFRPWKKAGSDDAQSNDNKWKVRALMNPFAKRKPAAKTGESTPQCPMDERVGTRPERIDSPAVRDQAAAPRRPATPSLSDPSLPVQHPLRPRVLRSREGLSDNANREPSSEAASPSWEPRAPSRSRRCRSTRVPMADGASNASNASNDREDKCEDQDSDATQVLPDWRARPDQAGNDDDSNNGNESPAIPDWRARPVQRQAIQLAKSKKPKAASTMDALADIKRRREERRQQQAEEKQRIKTELEQHGDDSGYKFRRLIQRYRDALPPAQSAPVATKSQSDRLPSLPNTSRETAVSPAKLLVFIRKRPLSKKELKAKGYDILTCLYSQASGGTQLDKRLHRELLCHEPKLKVDCSEALENHRFQFDGVFDEAQANEQVYEATVGPMIPYLLSKSNFVVRFPPNYQPNNLTIFAYGQTGSGKTYTMKSMYRQAAGAIFSRLDELCECVTKAPHVSIGVSFYEIYMNTVNDLLNGRSRVQIMEDGDGTVQLPGLKEMPIESADELLALVKSGEESRATSANAVHDDSSRSHALLRVTLYAEAGQQQAVMARLSMVDLAGSERACDTQSDSKNTRMEGAEINKSLLALKECIRALDRGASHIPFRQSKLTQLLRDSFLSENSKTIMIATVSPWSESCNHTLNTLRYADRLKEIGGG